MIQVDLSRGCTYEPCASFAGKLHAQLSNGYTEGVSAMPLPDAASHWQDAHRTARRRALHAARLGYTFGVIDRRMFQDDVFEINTSTPARQGRPMTEAYRERPSFRANWMACPRHHVYTYGVLAPRVEGVPRKLVAYLWMYRSGDLFLVSSILGHADHLASDVMYLLMSGAIARSSGYGGTLVYNLHRSGTDGLRFFKERIGLQPTGVEWKL